MRVFRKHIIQTNSKFMQTKYSTRLSNSERTVARYHATVPNLLNISYDKMVENEVKLIPWQIGMAPGYGIDFLTLGNKAARAVSSPPTTGLQPIPGLTGLISRVHDAQVITNRYQLAEQMNFSAQLHLKFKNVGFNVKVSSRIDSSKYDFVEETSTYVLVKSFVANAYEEYSPEFNVPVAMNLAKSNVEKFRAIYGDGYIKGIVKGGALMFTLKVTETDKIKQSHLAMQLAAAANTSFNGGTLETNLVQTLKEVRKSSNVTISHEQIGGSIKQDKNVEEKPNANNINPDELLQLIKDHEKDVQTNAIGLYAFIAPYSSALFTESYGIPDFVKYGKYADAIDRYNILKNKCEPLLLDIRSIKKNPEFYFNPPSTTVLKNWEKYLSDKVKLLDKNIELCENTTGTPNEIEDDVESQEINIPENIDLAQSKLLGDEWHIREGTSGKPYPWYGLWTRKNLLNSENLRSPYNFRAKWWYNANIEAPPNNDTPPGDEGELQITLENSKVKIDRLSSGERRFKYTGDYNERNIKNGKYETVPPTTPHLRGGWETIRKIKNF